MEKDIMRVECDCGAWEEFDAATGPKQFHKLNDEECTCPFCEEWSPEEPEGYTRPVFKPVNKEAV